MPKLCVGIVCGGRSLEHEISLSSAIRIARFIDKRRFDVIIIWIDQKTGCWCMKDITVDNFSYYTNSEYISILLKKCPHQFYFSFENINTYLKLDVIFPIIHGTLGEDGALQGLLRVMDVPFIGSDVLGSSISMNKDISKCLLRDAGLSVAPFKTFLFRDRYDIDFESLVSFFGLPFFVKPVDQGSSIGISKIVNYKNFVTALNIAFSFSNKILVESAIIGREIECAVLGNDNPEISVCGEIIMRDNNFYTYHDKYVESQNVQNIVPAIISDVISDKIRYIACRAFQILSCSGMARVDFFINSSNNKIFVNEVNTLPGFTDTSMYVKLWEATGLNLQTLITRLIELALDAYNKRNRINYTNNIENVLLSNMKRLKS